MTFRYSPDLFDDPTVAAAVIEAATDRCIYRLQGDALTIRSGDASRKDYPADFTLSAKADSSDLGLMIYRRKKVPR